CADAQGNIYVADIINCTVRMGTPALAIASFRPTFGIANGDLAFDLAGPAGEVASIETSSDLVNWHAVSAKQLPDPSQPLVTFQDPATNKFLFYRVRAP